MVNAFEIPCGKFPPGKAPGPIPGGFGPDGGSVDPPKKRPRPRPIVCREVVYSEPPDSEETGIPFDLPQGKSFNPSFNNKDVLPPDQVINCLGEDIRKDAFFTAPPPSPPNPRPPSGPPSGSPEDPPLINDETIILFDDPDSQTLTVTWDTVEPTEINTVLVFEVVSTDPVVLGTLINPDNTEASPGKSHQLTIGDIQPNFTYGVTIQSKQQFPDPLNPYDDSPFGPIIYLTGSPGGGELKSIKQRAIRDPRYSFYERDGRTFIPLRSPKFTNIYNPLRHRSVDAILIAHERRFGTDSKFIGDVSNRNLDASINKDLRNVLYNIKKSANEILDRDFWVEIFRLMLFSDDNSKFSSDYVLGELPKFSDLTTEPRANRSIRTIKKSAFGESNKSLAEDRKITTPSFQKIDLPNETRASLKAIYSRVPLDWRSYSNPEEIEKMKLWYNVPEDIRKRVSVTKRDGTNVNVTVNNDETFKIKLNDGSHATITVNPDDTIPSLSHIPEIKNIELTTSLHKAFSIKNHFLRDIEYDLGQDLGLKLVVETQDTDDVELNYDLSSMRWNKPYTLSLVASTIAEIDSESDFVKATSATYTRLTDADEIDANIKFKGYPWKVLMINHEDPIMGHINDDNATFRLEFKDFTLENVDETYLFPRKIPKAIVILPTNRTRFNIYNGLSTLVEWNKREIEFAQHIDHRYYNTGLLYNYLSLESTWPNTDISGNKNTQGLKFFHDRNHILFKSTYNETDEPLPRRKFGFRAAVNMVSSLDTIFENEGKFTWFDVLSRLSPREFYTFKYGVDRKMIDRLRRGERTGIKLTYSVFLGPDRDTSSKLGNVRSGQTDTTTQTSMPI